MRKLGTNLVNWTRIVNTEKGSNLAKNEEGRPNLRYFGIPSAIRVANVGFAKKWTEKNRPNMRKFVVNFQSFEIYNSLKGISGMKDSFLVVQL